MALRLCTGNYTAKKLQLIELSSIPFSTASSLRNASKLRAKENEREECQSGNHDLLGPRKQMRMYRRPLAVFLEPGLDKLIHQARQIR